MRPQKHTASKETVLDESEEILPLSCPGRFFAACYSLSIRAANCSTTRSFFGRFFCIIHHTPQLTMAPAYIADSMAWD